MANAIPTREIRPGIPVRRLRTRMVGERESEAVLDGDDRGRKNKTFKLTFICIWNLPCAARVYARRRVGLAPGER